MLTFTNRSKLLLSAAVFFLISLIVLTGFRLAFFYAYRSPETGLAWLLPALVTGFKVDAKWLSILLIPAWLFTLLAFWKSAFKPLALFAAVTALSAMVLLDLVNFGFFGFYRTPISAIIFGFFEDDTTAILKTILIDWPVFTYLFVLTTSIVIPVFLTQRLLSVIPEKAGTSRLSSFFIYALLSVLLVGAIRGSFGTFPLRMQDFSVSPIPFINQTVPNGAAAFYEALKSRKELSFKGSPESVLLGMGFANRKEAESVLLKLPEPAQMQPLTSEPHVVLSVMESMGRDLFEAHSSQNNMLGRLADELSKGTVFINGISVENGTFPSLEGLLFDSPYTPLTQSRYGNRTFSFSHVLRFKKAGWKTVFLTSGPEGWRQMDVNFPRQGFDEVIGSAAIRARYPDAEQLTWGIGDEWMFRTAESLLDEADQKGEKLFIVMLSSTNHGPHHVPDKTVLQPVSVDALPDVITSDRTTFNTEKLRTYQYAADALGGFVGRVREKSGKNGHRDVLISATGDHNGRYHYRPDGYWHHAYGVPVLFWLPDSAMDLREKADTKRFVGHRDIFPTLRGLVFGDRPELNEGRNLFADDKRELILSYINLGRSGFAVGADRLVILDGAEARCFRLSDNHFVPESSCSRESQTLGNAARAQRALSEYKVRSELSH